MKRTNWKEKFNRAIKRHRTVSKNLNEVAHSYYLKIQELERKLARQESTLSYSLMTIDYLRNALNDLKKCQDSVDLNRRVDEALIHTELNEEKVSEMKSI